MPVNVQKTAYNDKLVSLFVPPNEYSTTPTTFTVSRELLIQYSGYFKKAILVLVVSLRGTAEDNGTDPL